MTDAADRLRSLVDTWREACREFVTLVRELPEEEGELPTDLPGWSVRDNVAHTAHLEAVLAGAPEETLEVPPAEHLRGLMNVYTEQGVLARRDRSLGELCAEIEHAVSTRHDALVADPPSDPSAAPPATPGGIGWDTGTLLSNRPLDVWMHEQDIRRATGRPGGYDSAAARHTISVLGRALPMVVGKRVSAPAGTSVRLAVPEAGRTWTVRVGDDGRATRADDVDVPTSTVTLSAEDFVVLAGGRRPVERTRPMIEGDAEIGRRVLESLAVTP